MSYIGDIKIKNIDNLIKTAKNCQQKYRELKEKYCLNTDSGVCLSVEHYIQITSTVRNCQEEMINSPEYKAHVQEVERVDKTTLATLFILMNQDLSVAMCKQIPSISNIYDLIPYLEKNLWTRSHQGRNYFVDYTLGMIPLSCVFKTDPIYKDLIA